MAKALNQSRKSETFLNSYIFANIDVFVWLYQLSQLQVVCLKLYFYVSAKKRHSAKPTK